MTRSDLAPLLPLRDVVVFPHMVLPLFVGREKSVKALDAAMRVDKRVALFTQKVIDADSPSVDDLHTVGTLATILQLLRLPDGTVKVLVEGQERIQLADLQDQDDCIVANYTHLPAPEEGDIKQITALSRSVLSSFQNYAKLNKKISDSIITAITGLQEEPARLADSIVTHINSPLTKKQHILEHNDLVPRLEGILALLEAEIDVLSVDKRIRGQVRKQIEKNHKDYYLNEQMKAIQKELGDEDAPDEHEALKQQIDKAGMPKAAREKADAELKKLKMMPSMSSETTVVRNYLETLINFPWKQKSRIRYDLNKAQAALDTDHYGLEKVKERILEYLAVQQRVKKMHGPILCLVGPPGVGKTSLGESIAKATNRKFARIALGGVRDEAEIRGHRRTYVGSMPGKLVSTLSKVKVKNPLILFDEIDKMSTDFRGDPSSALLEVLDPEQNRTFSDHYLEVDTDLSEVMFICTANSLNIPSALLDRMEVIQLAGYTEDEKLNIAQNYLLSKQIKRNGLKADEMQLSEAALRDIIRYYTREAGVRNLDREIAKLARKVVKEIVADKTHQTSEITPDKLEKYLGVQRHRYGIADKEDRIGQVTGLAWTQVGGDLLTIESAVIPGKGQLIHTGQLGDVMKESVQAALTVVRSRAESLGIATDFTQKHDVHIHVPEGATPKDGPSAGSAMCTALISALTQVPVKASVAMTGEITLRGEVLPIGGLKEKLLAAHRGGITTVLIPEDNVKDLREIPENIKNKLDIQPVKWLEQVLQHALQYMPIPKKPDEEPLISAEREHLEIESPSVQHH